MCWLFIEFSKLVQYYIWWGRCAIFTTRMLPSISLARSIPWKLKGLKWFIVSLITTLLLLSSKSFIPNRPPHLKFRCFIILSMSNIFKLGSLLNLILLSSNILPNSLWIRGRSKMIIGWALSLKSIKPLTVQVLKECLTFADWLREEVLMLLTW